MNFKHGHARVGGNRSRTYRSWAHMKERCNNVTCHNYSEYGGRGIMVCERWNQSFENFLADMGEAPTGMTIERKNNHGNYEPGNCCWGTRQQQARNTRRNHIVTVRGKTGPLVEIVEFFGLNYDMIKTRLNKRGWEPEKAFFAPKRPWNRRLSDTSAIRS